MFKTPFILPLIYPNLTWKISTDEKVIYLTFDDGPIPEVTEFVLNTLNQFNAKATFFCIGENVRKHPAILDRVIEQGHSIGNHTYNHLNGWKHPSSTYVENVSKAASFTSSSLFRPPYGRISWKQIKALKQSYRIIMWDVLSGDFDTSLTAENCIENVLKHTESGSIIVFHDSEKAWPRLEKTLPFVLEKLKEKGYDFDTLS